MQLTLHTDVGMRCLIYLADQPKGTRMTISGLAEIFGVPRNHMVKIINHLGKGGYLLNVRGKGGGVSLGKDPHEINLTDVIRCLEAKTEVVDCSKYICPYLENCKLKNLLNQATDVFFNHIAQYTLADITTGDKKGLIYLQTDNKKQNF